jgi:hypothetical protein
METRPVVAGGAIFAAIMLIMAGCFNLINGLAALVKGGSYLALTDSGTLVFNLTAWGWIMLIFGIVQVAAGLGIWSGALWARIIGIAAAVLNAMAHMTFVGTYPFWSLIVIAVDILIIWALAVYSGPAMA